MSLVAEFNSLPLAALVKKSLSTSASAAREAAAKDKFSLADFAALISPAAAENLEALGQRAHTMTQQRFGKTIRLFAPLYLSNECVNNCSYCGFSRDNLILRVTLSIEEVLREAAELKSQGFRNVLLVAGEHPKFVSNNYLRDCIAALHADWPSVSLEVGPMEKEEYLPLVAAGADGLVSRCGPGPRPKLSAAQMEELRELVIAGPDAAIHQVVRWRCVDLRDEVARRFDVMVGERTIGKWLRKLRLTRLQLRPYHPKKDPAAEAAFKKTSLAC